MKKQFKQLRFRCDLSRYVLRAGVALMVACCLLALIILRCGPSADPVLMTVALPALLETAPGCLAAGVTAAVLIEIGWRDIQK
ncbi:MAG: hypothetical protein IJC25_01620 [Clostridia bacterium]|nr:hypothetical protein [Clostridia bacterium]